MKSFRNRDVCYGLFDAMYIFHRSLMLLEPHMIEYLFVLVFPGILASGCQSNEVCGRLLFVPPM